MARMFAVLASGRHAAISPISMARAAFSGSRVGTSRNSLAHINGANARGNGANARGLGNARTLGGRAAWNHWGNHSWRAGWNGGWGGWNGGSGFWGGSVFWPFFYGDLFAFALWPWGYYDPFWGTVMFSSGMPCSGQDLITPMAPAPFYGDLCLWRPRAVSHRAVAQCDAKSPAPRTNTNDLAQNCGELAPGVTDLPIDSIERASSRPTNSARPSSRSKPLRRRRAMLSSHPVLAKPCLRRWVGSTPCKSDSTVWSQALRSFVRRSTISIIR